MSESSNETNIEKLQKQICYSDRYSDDKYEYRHVIIPEKLVKYVPKTHLMSETQWRNIGIQQSRGWVHYMMHKPEPHVLLFKRAISPVKEPSQDSDSIDSSSLKPSLQ